MNIKKYIPDTITSMNVLCGSLGVIASFNGRQDLAFLLMIAASVFDFFDGFAARALDAYSALGKELDSLCDMVSFGVLPAVMLFNISAELRGGIDAWCFFPLLIVIFSALRLAKFNIDERQTLNFIGLPTPACAVVCCSLVYYVTKSPDSFLHAWVAGKVFIPVISVILAYLLISEVPMFSMKMKKGEKSYTAIHRLRIAFFGCVLASAVFTVVCGLNWSMIALISFTAYIILNVAHAILGNK